MATGKSLNDMISAVTYELGSRTDLQANGTVLRYIQNAIEIYQKERFRFNEIAPLAPFTFNTVAGVAFYDAAAVPNIGLLMRAEYVNTVIGSTVERLHRATPEEIYLALEVGTEAGQPLSFALDGNSIVFYPRPNDVWPIIVGGYLAVAGPAVAPGTDTTNVWMNDAEMLIRSRTKYEIAVHVTRNKEMQELMSPDNGGAADRAFSMLKADAARFRGRGRVVGMQF